MIGAIVLGAVTAEGQAHGLSPRALEIGRPFGFPITNSMVVTWIVALALIVFARLATRNMKQVPDGLQNFAEWLIDGLYGVSAMPCAVSTSANFSIVAIGGRLKPPGPAFTGMRFTW